MLDPRRWIPDTDLSTTLVVVLVVVVVVSSLAAAASTCRDGFEDGDLSEYERVHDMAVVIETVYQGSYAVKVPHSEADTGYAIDKT